MLEDFFDAVWDTVGEVKDKIVDVIDDTRFAIGDHFEKELDYIEDAGMDFLNNVEEKGNNFIDKAFNPQSVGDVADTVGSIASCIPGTRTIGLGVKAVRGVFNKIFG